MLTASAPARLGPAVVAGIAVAILLGLLIKPLIGALFGIAVLLVVGDSFRAVAAAIALRHCLLSYVFGTVILGATINVVIGLVGG